MTNPFPPGGRGHERNHQRRFGIGLCAVSAALRLGVLDCGRRCDVRAIENCTTLSFPSHVVGKGSAGCTPLFFVVMRACYEEAQRFLLERKRAKDAAARPRDERLESDRADESDSEDELGGALTPPPP